MLNFFASFTLYAAIAMIAFVGIGLCFASWWIFQAYQHNRRMNAWLRRIEGTCPTTNTIPWGRKAGR